jgi:GTP cyclohydrolase I
VVVSGLRYHSMCPHDLLPVQGVAHVAYVPGDRIVGFGRLGALVDCFAHRLILQEEIARQVARALVSVLGSPGAACVLDAEHGCMRIKGGRDVSARAHSEAYEGVLRTDRELRRTLWSRLA